jgi:hypothetical protein
MLCPFQLELSFLEIRLQYRTKQETDATTKISLRPESNEEAVVDIRIF